MAQNMNQGNIGLLDQWRAGGNTGDLPVGWNGSGGDGGNGGGNGFQPLAAPDVAKLRDQIYQTLQPYYVQLAKEAQGDFGRAVSMLQEDYTKGTRDARINFAFTKQKQLDDLDGTLSTLGISNVKEQKNTIDDLNKRGMAVYQNNPDGTPNVVRPSTITADTSVNPDGTYKNSSAIENPADANMGEGGFELAQLQRTQQLQQEAQQRAATKPIEQSGIALKQYTNLPAGIDPNLPPDQLAKALSAPGVDRSSLGTAEQGLVRGQETQTRDLQKTQEDLANQRSSDVNSIAAPLVATGTKEADSSLTNELLKERQTNFVNNGVS